MTRRIHMGLTGLVALSAFGALFCAGVWAADVGTSTVSEAPDGVLTALQNEMVKGGESVEKTTQQESPASDSGGFLGAIGRTLVVLAVVVVLILVLSGGLKRITGVKVEGGGGGKIRVLARTALSPKSRVYLLDVEGRRVLVGEAGGQIRSLGSYSAANEEPDGGETIDEAAADQDEASFTAALGTHRTDKRNRGFLDRVMAGIRDLRQEKMKLTRSGAASAVRPRREH